MSRIAVTGMGVVSPIGVGVDAFHEGLSEGRPGLAELEFPWKTGGKVNRAGVVQDFDQDRHAPEARDVGRASQFTVAAVREAIEGAGGLSSEQRDRTGVMVGTAMGDMIALEAEWEAFGDHDDPHPSVHPHWMRFGNPPDVVATAFGLRGPTHTLAAACAAGNQAIAWAIQALRQRDADVMIAAGMDAIGYLSMLGFQRLRLQGTGLCRPFDRKRGGTVLAEGAGALVLERLDDATRRGADVLAEITGYGVSCDAGGPFASKIDDRRGMRVGVERALAMARISPEQIDHVSAHGTGTKLNDRKETLLLKEVMGSHAHAIPINSIKSMFGHTQGAAPSLEAISSILTLQKDIVYPTINYENPDPECDLDYVPNQAREQRVNTILSNAFGIGGSNAIIVLQRWEGR